MVHCQFARQRQRDAFEAGWFPGMGNYRLASQDLVRYSTAESQHNFAGRVEKFQPATSFPHEAIAQPFREGADRVVELATKQSVCVSLDLDSLESFETVDKQYHPWGVTFRNAIALQPSNSSYPACAGELVLMGSPNSGWIELLFERPVRCFNCRVTSSQRILLSAYDRDGEAIAQDELPQANLAHSEASIPPNALLKVTSPHIARIHLYAFDGQFTVDSIRFCF